ncbi:hypothetical protein HXX76_014791 [Chlamydomonas incerta]|uniref:Uncharacterized protein n=1 Tax=Chlamydomonas incerta TaxID=51695 RepID=A0A835SB94_CHLIN|nr:hypothetical protein HXX76_014791 [Chlamydomonas incerta]|eukprot:KAG2424117.1 hypothetical protein HXX76_014791 [Chlamydomonas incerta]
MLADNCPGCKVPLMKPRDSEERLCVNCNTTYVLDGQGLRPTNSSAGTGDASSSADAGTPAGAGGSASASTSTSGRAQPAGAGAAGSAHSNGGAVAGGQRGLQDGPDDPGRPNGAGPLGEAGEDEEEDDYDARADPRLGPFSTAATATASATAGEGGKAAGGGAAAGSGRKQQAEGEDVADLLSAKMLQGWALLDRYCPRCSTVLVRSKATKQMFCVSCDAWVVPEGEHVQQQQQQPTPAAAGTEASGPQPAAAGAADAAQPTTAGTSSPPQALREQVPAAAAPAPAPASAPPPAPTAAVAAPPQPQAGAGAAGFLADVLGAGPATGVAAGVMYGGYESSSRGSSPPPMFAMEAPFLTGGAASRLQQQSQQAQHAQLHQAANAHAGANANASTHQPGHHLRANFAAGLGAGLGGGSASGGKSPAVGGNAMLLSVSRTVALKMTEAQQQLERTSVLELDRARGLVGFVGECLDLLAKLHRLQAQ